MTTSAKLFDIPALKMPSEAEMNANAERRMSMIRDTLIDRWPKEIHDLSMKTALVPFDKELAFNLFDGGPPRLGQAAMDLAARLDAECGWSHKFFRLNSRSPKDAPFPLELPVTCSGKEMLSVIASSERCLDDIVTFHRTADPLYICLRDFVPEMQEDAELRCFVKDSELLAVAQYGFGSGQYPEDVRAVIDGYFSDVLKPRLHIQTVVFDVLLRWNNRPLLIELNPYGLSDPVGAGSYRRIEEGIPGIAMRSEQP